MFNLAKNILQSFYYKILPTLKVNRNLLIELLSILPYIGGIGLKSTEMK